MSYSGSVVHGAIVLDPPVCLADGTLVAVAVRDDGEAVATRFADLVREWKAAKVFTSSGSEIAMHPANQQIIGMGMEAVPLILDELRRDPDHWFWALKAIMGADPVAAADRGNLPRMTEARLQWSDQQGVR